MDVIRLPLRWEQLQPELFGALDSAELDLVNGFVGVAWAHGMRVILDPHNYWRYCETVSYRSDSCSDERLIGRPAVPSVPSPIHGGAWQPSSRNPPTSRRPTSRCGPKPRRRPWTPFAQPVTSG